MRTSPPDAPADADLVLAAQAGDVSALGTLLARHRPALLAVAISLTGYGSDAEDAVQEASMIALSRIGDLRDPAAAGPWLRTVVRNVCRMRFRSPSDLSLDTGRAAMLPSSEPDPAQLLDRHAIRDWVWRAMEELSPALRLVVMLRYFSGVTAYRDIADACGVPVGTVRSRLNEARGRLARAVLATAHTAHGDIRAVTEARRRDAEEILAALPRGDLGTALAASWSPAVEVSGLRGIPGAHGVQAAGYDPVIRELEQDVANGLGGHLLSVAASHDLAVCEFGLRSPSGNHGHFPPGAGWVLHLRSGWVEQVRIFRVSRPGSVLER